jgi:hypothetical protein
MARIVGLVLAYRKLSVLRPNLILSRVTSPTFRAHLVRDFRVKVKIVTLR